MKDLSRLGRPEKDIIFIDNSPTSYMLQPECSLPILSWYNDKRDVMLRSYVPLLVEMARLNDVREAIPHFVHNNVIIMNLAFQVCQEIFEKDDKHRMPAFRVGLSRHRSPMSVLEETSSPKSAKISSHQVNKV